MEASVAEIIAALGWPHFAFAFGTVFLVLFWKELRGFLNRVTSIDRTGIKTEPNPEAQREDQKKLEAAQELMLAIGNTVVIQDIEGRIRNDLVARHLDIEGETTKVLIKYLAASMVALEFEQIQNFIFGSQIFFLKKLNEVSGQGQSPTVVQAHFEQVQKMFPDSFGEWPQERYLHFLLARKLIVLKEGNYHITNLGNEYLVWMARTGRRENNPL
jgi:hypothetical protein